MNTDSRPGMSLSGRMLLLMVLVVGVSAATVLGLGLWAIQLLGSAGAAASTVQTTTVLGVTLGATALVVFVSAGCWLWTRSLIRGRVLSLAEVFNQASGGDRSLRAVVTGDDEFATLASAFNALLDSGTGGASLGENQDAAALQSQIEKLLQEVSAVGDGDLRVQAEVTPDTLGVLADSFNYMIEELAKVVGRVQATTLQVTNATRRLLDRSAEVAQASEAQSAQISQTSESVARLANFVSLSARNARTASDNAQDALRNAQLGQTAVVQTIDGMVHIRENVQETSKRIKRLGERSQEVGEIVRLIEDIADQTNLLALNAAIQSAMAGEHGRGFAVVADEIRLLAERSAEATKRIATIVKSIQGDTYEAVVAMEESTQEVVNGSRLADEAGQALQSIFVAVERQAQTIEGIAHAAAERAPISDEVANAMGQISEITRQTNIATQDAASSVSYLAELAEQLRASVAAFRLPERATEPPALPLPTDNGFPQPLNLPNLGNEGWGGQADYPLPALPAATGAPNFGGMPDYGNGAMPDYNNGGMPNYGNGGMPNYSNGAMPDYNNGGMPDFGNGAMPNYGVMPDYGAGAPNPGPMPDYNNGGMPAFGNPGMPEYNNGGVPNYPQGQYSPLDGAPAQPGYPGAQFPAGPTGGPRFPGESY